MSETPNDNRFAMSLSAMLSILSLVAAGAGTYSALNARVTAIETTAGNVHLAELPVKIAELQGAAATAGEANRRTLARVERLLCRTDDHVRERECRRMQEGPGYE